MLEPIKVLTKTQQLVSVAGCLGYDVLDTGRQGYFTSDAFQLLVV